MVKSLQAIKLNRSAGHTMKKADEAATRALRELTSLRKSSDILEHHLNELPAAKYTRAKHKICITTAASALVDCCKTAHEQVSECRDMLLKCKAAVAKQQEYVREASRCSRSATATATSNTVAGNSAVKVLKKPGMDTDVTSMVNIEEMIPGEEA